MKTAMLTAGNTRWGRIFTELNTLSLASTIAQACRALGLETIEPHNGPIAMLSTGAKLYWSDSEGVASISGYAWDGSDVDHYLYD